VQASHLYDAGESYRPQILRCGGGRVLKRHLTMMRRTAMSLGEPLRDSFYALAGEQRRAVLVVGFRLKGYSNCDVAAFRCWPLTPTQDTRLR
jgi:hypothetical protein